MCIRDRMRETERKLQILSLHLGIVTDTLNFQFLFKTFCNTDYHVINESTVQTVKGTAFNFIIRTGNDHMTVFELDRNFRIDCMA